MSFHCPTPSTSLSSIGEVIAFLLPERVWNRLGIGFNVFTHHEGDGVVTAARKEACALTSKSSPTWPMSRSTKQTGSQP